MKEIIKIMSKIINYKSINLETLINYKKKKKNLIQN